MRKLCANRILTCCAAARFQIRTLRLRIQKIPLISALALMTPFPFTCDWYPAKVGVVAQVS